MCWRCHSEGVGIIGHGGFVKSNINDFYSLSRYIDSVDFSDFSYIIPWKKVWICCWSIIPKVQWMHTGLVGCDLRVQGSRPEISQLQWFAGLTSPQELPTTSNSPHELELRCLLKPLVKIGGVPKASFIKVSQGMTPFLVNISGGCNFLGVWILVYQPHLKLSKHKTTIR